MKLIFALAFFLMVLPGRAQMALDVNMEPEPMDFAVKAMSPEFKVPMKKMTWIKINDTMMVYDIDKKGNKIKEHHYYRNKRSAATTAYTYAGKLLTRSVLGSPSDKVTTDYKYNPSGKCLEWSKTTEISDKKVYNSNPYYRHEFEYDTKGNLVKRYRVDAGKTKTLSAEYFYDDNNRLKEALINGQMKSVFKYDEKGNLLSREEALNGSSTSNSSYEYDEQGRVIAEHYRNYSINHIYENGRLSRSVYSSWDTTMETVDFYYKDGLLSEVNVQKTYLGSHSPFRLHPDHEPSTGNYKLKIELLYDSHKNTKELKYYVNDSYKYSEKFITEYYK